MLVLVLLYLTNLLDKTFLIIYHYSLLVKYHFLNYRRQNLAKRISYSNNCICMVKFLEQHSKNFISRPCLFCYLTNKTLKYINTLLL